MRKQNPGVRSQESEGGWPFRGRPLSGFGGSPRGTAYLAREGYPGRDRSREGIRATQEVDERRGNVDP